MSLSKLKLKNARLWLVLKKYWWLYLFLNLLIFYLLFKENFVNLNFKDFTLYLYVVLVLLVSLNIICFIYDIKKILSKKSKIEKGKSFSFISLLFSSILLPFSQVCIAGVCSYGVLISIAAILPGFLVPFLGHIVKYLDFFLVLAILLQILSLHFSKCFTSSNEKVSFNINKINLK